MTLTLDSPFDALREALRAIGDRRAYLVRDTKTGGVVASHPLLDRVRAGVENDDRDYHDHEAMFFELSEPSGAVFAAFLHRTVRGQGAGGVRHWPYETVGGLVRDGLRLSQGMGRKNALAGLWWGGGKGIIARPDAHRYDEPGFRERLYRDYGRFISSLRGCYVTAEDVGTNAADMAEVFRTTRFVTCVPPAVGGSGNPSPSTALGVVCAIEGALDHTSRGTIAGARIAMQGTGNVGAAMIDILLERGAASIVATEIDEARRDALAARFQGHRVEVRLVGRDDRSIFAEECDVFAPNALGGVLDTETIPLLRTGVVCGAANNQLLDDRRDDKLLRDRGIVFVPDFVANRMGIVNCANEQYGTLPEDPAIARHFGRSWDNSVFRVTQRVLTRADQTGATPTEAANALADDLGREPHPVFPHRGRAIIESLVSDQWQRGSEPDPKYASAVPAADAAEGTPSTPSTAP